MAGIENLEKAEKFGNIVSGAGNVVSGLVGAADSIFGWSQKRQQRNQKELMDKQQDQWKEQQNILAQQQLDQWNRENAYNDPSNYYKRLLQGAEANGITKAAALGDQPGGSVGTSAQGVSAPGSPAMTSASGAPMYGIGSGVMAGMRQIAEIANIEAHTEKTKGETQLLPVNKQIQEAIVAEKQKNLEVMDSIIKDNFANVEEKGARASLHRAQESFTRANELLVNAEEAKTYADRDKILREVDKLEIDNDIARKYGMERARLELNRTKALIQLTLAEKEVQNEMKKKLGAERYHQMMENGVYARTANALVKSIKAKAVVDETEARFAEADKLDAYIPQEEFAVLWKALQDGDKNVYEIFVDILKKAVDEGK